MDPGEDETPPTQMTSLIAPLEGPDLLTALGQVPLGIRLDDAFSTHLIACVSLGFARIAVPQLRRRAGETENHPLKSALTHLATSLAHTSILDAAATYDQAGEGADSLANGLMLATRHLRSSTNGTPGDREAARKLVDSIRQSVISQKSSELRAVQFWRNKWAGHRTSDPRVDPWAWENPIDFNVIEVALEQMRAAFHEFAVLLELVPELTLMHANSRRVDDSTVRMGISLEGTSGWPIGIPIGIGESQAQAFLDRALPVLVV